MIFPQAVQNEINATRGNGDREAQILLSMSIRQVVNEKDIYYPFIHKHLLASCEVLSIRFHTALMEESTKRKMKEAEKARTFASLVPSAFAKSKNWCNYINSESDNGALRLMHGRPGSNKFIDVGLIHPDFAKI